jgi:ABC-type transporter Mla subunit MlaD
MTQANENNSRLDRIEALVLQLATANLQHSAAITRHDEEFSRINNAIEQLTTETRASINDLVNMIGTLGQNADRHWEVIQRHWEAVQEMQAEVRGLQTENRRILERLEQHTSNGHGDQ